MFQFLFRKIFNPFYSPFRRENIQSLSIEETQRKLQKFIASATQILSETQTTEIMLKYTNGVLQWRHLAEFTIYEGKLELFYSNQPPIFKEIQHILEGIDDFMSLVIVQDGGYALIMTEENGTIKELFFHPQKKNFFQRHIKDDFVPIMNAAQNNRLPDGISKPIPETSAHDVLIAQQTENAVLFCLQDYKNYMQSWTILKKEEWVAIFSIKAKNPPVCLAFWFI